MVETTLIIINVLVLITVFTGMALAIAKLTGIVAALAISIDIT